MHIHIHRSMDEVSQETYKGFLIKQSEAGWDVSENGEHYMTYRSLVLAKKGIDRLEQALREMAMKKKAMGGRLAG